MKILITSDWYLPTINGVVNSVMALSTELVKLGHEVKIVTLSPTTKSYIKDNVIYIGSMSAGKIYPEARLRTKFAVDCMNTLIEWKPDIIHSQCEFSTFLAAKKVARATGAPIIHTYHTVYEDYSHYFMPSTTLAHYAVSLFSNFISKHVDCLIAPTQKIKDLLLGYRIKTRTEVIPSGIDLSLFTVDYPETELLALREKLGIPAGNKVLINIGRIAKEKNLDELVTDIASLKRNDITFLIVGDGPYRQALAEEVKDSGVNVVFAGMIPHDKIGMYYKLGDIFVSASTSETQGLTYDEALASGVPALCKKDPCIEGVIIDGVNGWQFTNRAEFSAKLAEFLSSEELLEKMSKNARETGLRFGSAFFASTVASLYGEVIEAKKEAADN